MEKEVGNLNNIEKIRAMRNALEECIEANGPIDAMDLLDALFGPMAQTIQTFKWRSEREADQHDVVPIYVGLLEQLLDETVGYALKPKTH